MTSFPTQPRWTQAPARTRAEIPSSRVLDNRFILLMQMGWVVVGLVAIASFPALQSPPVPVDTPEARSAKMPVVATAKVDHLAGLFMNGSDSLVARTVGHAEGTRAPNGSRNPAYFGHTDPGNGVWNLGSFSFQHCREPRYHCSTPEQADRMQLQRLVNQAETLRQRAISLKLPLTLEQALNGIDLANQAPLAALGQPGYADYLAQAQKRGLKGQAAILEARLWSFWHPTQRRWDAPGLGNTENRIRHDQQRRMLAIARVLAVYQLPQGDVGQRANHWLSRRLRENPYSFDQRTQYLWWDAGYWDARLQRGRQVPVGYEADYDRGYQDGL